VSILVLKFHIQNILVSIWFCYRFFSTFNISLLCFLASIIYDSKNCHSPWVGVLQTVVHGPHLAFVLDVCSEWFLAPQYIINNLYIQYLVGFTVIFLHSEALPPSEFLYILL
jgi:hypothetical protein